MSRPRTLWWLVGLLALAVLVLGVIQGGPWLETPSADGAGGASGVEVGGALGGVGSDIGDARTLTGRSDASTAGDAPRRGPLTVRVLAPSGVPLAGVPMALQEAGGEEPEGSEITSGAGEVTFPDVAYDGSRQVGLLMERPPIGKRIRRGPDWLQRWIVVGPRLEVRATYGVRHRVEAVDAVDGTPLEGVFTGVWPRFVDHREAPSPGNWLAAPTRHMRWWMYFRARPGHLVHGTLTTAGYVPPDVHTIRYVRPFHPEASVTVSAASGSEFPETEGAEAYVFIGHAGADGKPLQGAGFGRYAIPGIHFVARAHIRVRVTFADDSWADGEGRMPSSPREGVHVELRRHVPDPHVADHRESSSMEVEEEEVEEFEEVFEPNAATAGSLHVHLLRPDGSPGRDAVVRVLDGPRGTTDAKGVLILEDIKARERIVEILGIGVARHERVQIRPGETTELRVRGDAGATLRIQVVDEEGVSLPLVDVRILLPDGLPYTDVAEGVLRKDRYTDRRGVRVFHRVPPGRIRLTTEYGGMRHPHTVDVTSGRRAVVTLIHPLAFD